MPKDKMTASEFQDYWRKQEKAKSSKYSAVPTQSNDGTKFHSHAEMRYFQKMKLLERTGEVKLVERSVRYEFTVNDIFICAYILDFRITYADGRVEYIDVKSDATVTPLYRLKKQLMLACHGIHVQEFFDKSK